jgi:hypothetical protein
MTQQASQQTLSKPKSTKAAKPKASVGGGSVRAQKQAAKYSQMTQQASKGKSTGSGKRTRSFSEGKIKRDGIGRFASKGSSARK